VMMGWGIATQEPVRTQLSPEQMHKIQMVARECDSRCAAYISSCKGDNIAGCYRASACKCECNLQLDPGNAAGGTWRQCVKKYTSLAEALGSHNTHRRP
jgi:hypothetical protein